MNFGTRQKTKTDPPSCGNRSLHVLRHHYVHPRACHVRKRHIPELKAANATQRGFGERTAMNHPMQGSAADIIKLAMTEVQRRIMERGFEAKLLLQVHDELDFSVPEREIEELSAIVKDVMEHIVDLRVPLDVDVSYADNWAEAH